MKKIKFFNCKMLVSLVAVLLICFSFSGCKTLDANYSDIDAFYDDGDGDDGGCSTWAFFDEESLDKVSNESVAILTDDSIRTLFYF